MQAERWRLALAASILVVGAVFLMRTLHPWSSTPSVERRAPAPDAPRLAAATLTARQAGAASEELADAIRHGPVEGAIEGDLSAAQISALAGEASSRLALLIEPDYDRFREYFKRTTGRDPPSGTEGPEADRKTWMSASAFFAGAPTDPAGTRVALRAHNGQVLHEPAGQLVTITVKGGYGRLSDPLTQRFTAVDVYLPIEGKDARTLIPIRVYYVMRFGWDPQRTMWQPLGQGICDPENRSVALLPPPI